MKAVAVTPYKYCSNGQDTERDVHEIGKGVGGGRELTTGESQHILPKGRRKSATDFDFGMTSGILEGDVVVCNTRIFACSYSQCREHSFSECYLL